MRFIKCSVLHDQNANIKSDKYAASREQRNYGGIVTTTGFVSLREFCEFSDDPFDIFITALIYCLYNKI